MSGANPSVAFYTPLKHPFQCEASGDRQIGLALMDGLRAAGFEPELASRFQSWRRAFDSEDAERLERAAAWVVETLVRRYRRRSPERRPRFWMTYQNYYRCPDLLGPAVATALDIPYVLASTAVSRSSRRTPFRAWVSAARLAARRADLIFAMSPRDVPGLASLRGPSFAASRLLLLPPAVDLTRFRASRPTRDACRADLARRFSASDGALCLCVASMRVADKLDSYRLLAATLTRLSTDGRARPWRLLVVGDGPARSAVEAAMATLPAERVCLAGALDPEALPPLYLGADLFVFPGIGEDFGMVYLEAAAAGLPMVACLGPGPGFAVAPGGGILTEPTPQAFAEGLRSLLDDPERRERMGAAALRFVASERSLDLFRRRLAEGLGRLDLP